MSTVSIAEVARRLALQPRDVVAVVQQLIHRSAEERGEAQPPFGPPSPENIALRSDGTVVCTGCPATPSIAETAILLQNLLAETQSVPGGLQHVIGRALQEVEGPPFYSIDDFSSALARHEQDDSQAVVRRLLERFELAPTALAVALLDRRAYPPIVAELRRQLRDADRALFERPAALVSTPTADRMRVPAIVAAVAAGIVTILAGQTLNLQREKTRAAGRNVVSTAPASATVAPPVSANIAAPAPAPVAVPVPANIAAPAPAKATAPVARATRVEVWPRTVRVAARRVASARAKTAGAKPGSRAPRAPKPRHRRWFGLRFFSDQTL
jgi:hypothetical protein